MQSIHAAQSAIKDFPLPNNLHVIVCSARDEGHLRRLVLRYNLYAFEEPDLGGSVTAAASAIVTDRRPYKSLKLYKERLK